MHKCACSTSTHDQNKMHVCKPLYHRPSAYVMFMCVWYELRCNGGWMPHTCQYITLNASSLLRLHSHSTSISGSWGSMCNIHTSRWHAHDYKRSLINTVVAFALPCWKVAPPELYRMWFVLKSEKRKVYKHILNIAFGIKVIRDLLVRPHHFSDRYTSLFSTTNASCCRQPGELRFTLSCCLYIIISSSDKLWCGVSRFKVQQ